MHPTDGAHPHTPYILANKLRYKQKNKIKIKITLSLAIL